VLSEKLADLPVQAPTKYELLSTSNGTEGDSFNGTQRRLGLDWPVAGGCARSPDAR
jgi:hypothetical protein